MLNRYTTLVETLNEDDNYYLTVLRYIHQNPHKAGIEEASKYMWSSYSEYLSTPKIVDIDFALCIIGGAKVIITKITKVKSM